MTKRMLIDSSHAEQTRVVIMDNDTLLEFDSELSNQRSLKGNIYLAKITRVEPSLQAAFVDYGGKRHGVLPFGRRCWPIRPAAAAALNSTTTRTTTIAPKTATTMRSKR